MLNRFICATHERGTLAQPVPAPLFRKEFRIDKLLKRASLRICGLGLYRLYLNGQDITKGAFAPYISNTDDLVYVDEYVLTEHLRPGDNALCVILGNGLQNALGAFTWELDTASFQSAPKMAFEMILEYEDNTQAALYSDESVLTAPSPILFNDLWCGEYYDARQAFDWLSPQPQCDNPRWCHALPTETPRGEQRVSRALPIRVHQTRKPAAILPVENGFLYDFGINDAGIFTLNIKDTVPGQTVTLTLGEYWDGQQFNNKKLFFVPEALAQVDRYICRGDAEEIWNPVFVYHGYRYILVQGITAQQATDTLLTYQVMHADLQERGQFHCSDPILEQVQEITRRSLLCNFFFYPTDCPHREKHGWTDAGQWAEAVIQNWAPEDSYREWLVNIRASQDKTGMLPGIVPTGGWGMNLGGPYWDAVIINLPWLMWKYRGELSCFRENAEAVIRYIRYLSGIRDERGLISFGIGDWCPVGKLEPRDFKAPIVVTDTAISYDICRKAAKLFALIGDDASHQEALALETALRSAMRKHLVNWNTMTVDGNCQTSQAIFLYYHIFENTEWAAAVKVLTDIIHRDGDFMDIGCIGGRILFHVLSEAGETAFAYQMITRPEFPSFRNWLDRGATTLWEDFQEKEEDVCSRNHPMWGDISNWMYQWVAGLQINPRLRACNEAVIRPGFSTGIRQAEAWHNTPAGRIGVQWSQEDNERTLQISVKGKNTIWLTLDEAGLVNYPITCAGSLCNPLPEPLQVNGINYTIRIRNVEEST